MGGRTSAIVAIACSRTLRIADHEPDEAGGHERQRHDREEGAVGQPAGEQRAAGAVIPGGHREDRPDAIAIEQGLEARGPSTRQRRQSRRSSKSPGCRASARTRRGGAISARTSPRRTKRRPAELDALEAARAGPRADRGGPEPDVRRGQDLRGFGEADPVGRGGHGQSASADLAGAGSAVLAGAAVPCAARRCSLELVAGGPRLAGARRRGAVLLGPAGALEMDGGRGKCLAHRALLPAVRAEPGAGLVDAVDHLDDVTTGGAAVVVDGHGIDWAPCPTVSRAGGACRTSGSRRPARARTGTRSGRRRRRPGRARPRAVRRP